MWCWKKILQKLKRKLSRIGCISKFLFNLVHAGFALRVWLILCVQPLNYLWLTLFYFCSAFVRPYNDPKGRHREPFFLRSSTRFSRYQEVKKVSIAESNVPRQLSPADQRMRGQLWKSSPIKIYRKHPLSSKFEIKRNNKLNIHWRMSS